MISMLRRSQSTLSNGKLIVCLSLLVKERFSVSACCIFNGLVTSIAGWVLMRTPQTRVASAPRGHTARYRREPQVPPLRGRETTVLAAPWCLSA